MTTTDAGPAAERVERVEIRSGAYADSVTLMQISRTVAGVPGVLAAQVAMGTDLNLDVLRGMGFDLPDGVGANDLVVAVRAQDDAAVTAADDALAAALAPRRPRSGGGGGAHVDLAAPTTGSAAAQGEATLALISLPGQHAFTEAFDALLAGLDVMLFSDNVTVEQERRLKDEAAARGLLVMGPDCGTAVVNGVGLGFANVVAPGPVGIVAASGTGAQQVMSLLDGAGVGVRHCLGVGGRDLSTAIGGRSTRQALRLLDDDPGVELIVLVSKPPALEVAAEIEQFAATLHTPVVKALLGPGQPDLTEAVAHAVSVLAQAWTAPRTWGAPAPQTPGDHALTRDHALTADHARAADTAGEAATHDDIPSPGAVRGAFSGGTLCDEAMQIASVAVGPIASNIPLAGAPAVGPDLAAPTGGAGHVMIDFGEDELTRGRPHPMIDGTIRTDWILRQAADPATSTILLDVVLGHGSHPDPAADLAPALTTARRAAADQGRQLRVVVSLCGTSGDPQGLDRQAEALVAAGAEVYASNAAAARAAFGIGDESTDRGNSEAHQAERFPRSDDQPVGAPVSGLLTTEPHVVTAGVSLFGDALRDQSVEVVEVDWRPPLEPAQDTGSGVLAAALATVIGDPRRPAANALAAQRMLEAGARIVDVRPASEALGLERGSFLHAGPPITWERASGPLRGALQGAMVLEGLASDPDDAARQLEAGAAPVGEGGPIQLDSCHHHRAVGPMAGVVSPSMWMVELENPATGARAFCSLNEGLGAVLRYGAYGDGVITRLRWMSDVLGPMLRHAVRTVADTGSPIDAKAILAQMVQMGDEAHNRNRAGTLMLLRDVLPPMIEAASAPGSPFTDKDVADAVRFVAGNDHFFLNVAMPACKLITDAARDIPGSTVVVAMARNGTDFGIQVSGTGDRWFTGPANTPEGLYLGSYGPDDANPDIGDSAITETAGLGGFAMAAAPAIVRFVGGDVPFALATTRRMYEITETENPAWGIPVLEFRGTPTGIDVTKVVRTGILPQINTGMAGRVAGVGQVGAGLVTPPGSIFPEAVLALADAVDVPADGVEAT